MKCARALDLFSSYAENAIEPPLRVVFEQHLAECSECRAEYEKFNATVMMLEEMPMVGTPAGFHAAVMARVEQARRATPSPVRWWHLDWERVFTVRVPARAVALGMAVLLLMVLVVQLTPVTSVVANFFGVPQPGMKNTIGTGDQAPKPYSAVSNWAVSGLSINVGVGTAAGSQTSYTLRLETKSSEAIAFSVSMVTGEASGELESSGYVARSQPAVVPVYVDRAGRPAVARVDWQYKDRKYSEFVFLPSTFAAEALVKSFSLSDASVFRVLSTISETYGIVILATGDMTKRIGYAGVENQMPSDALYNAVRSTGLKWHAVGQSVYMVEPGP
ncbi:MAG: zf-HC2 domain-containing protein [Armatimonadetes bacterium]|nr:zf-HC2 domain-containing protein [Armatimonadota bacterium]